jgi:biopolymer transport protein ExbD
MAKKRGRSKRTKPFEGLIITSLIDVFVILLIFLLRNFSTEGNLTSNADNLSLPNSDSQKRLTEVSLQVAVTSDMIIVDNEPIVPTEDAAKIPQTDETQVIPKLIDNLKAHYAQEMEMVKLGALNKAEGKLVIQMDKNISFDILYKVMMTCASAGYMQMIFAVMQRGGE